MKQPDFESLVRTTAPAGEPVRLAEARSNLNVDHDGEDLLIKSMIAAARDYVERYVSHAMITQQWRATFRSIHIPTDYRLRLPVAPLQSVESVKYYDSAGTLQTVSTADYYVDTYSEPGCIEFSSLPSLQSRPNALQVNFTSGYGDDPKDVPEALRQAVHYLVVQLYEQRSPVVTGVMATQVPQTLRSILQQFKPVVL